MKFTGKYAKLIVDRALRTMYARSVSSDLYHQAEAAVHSLAGAMQIDEDTIGGQRLVDYAVAIEQELEQKV